MSGNIHNGPSYKGISNCSNTKAFGPDEFSIFHLKNIGPNAIEYLTALFNDSVTFCRIPAIWKSSIVILIPNPGKDSSLFLPGHSATSALLQLTSDAATCFNQRKPPHQTICVAVDLTAALDTANHNVLLSKIARSTLPE